MFTIQYLILQRRQDWLRDYLIQLEIHPLAYVGKFGTDTSIDIFVKDLRDKLGLQAGWTMTCPTWEDTLGILIDTIERIGIIVIQNGIVGNNTSRPIPVEECRGFVLVDDYVPFMFLNNADAKAAQLFTLIHELAHVWLGKSAGFNQDQLLPASNETEILCDRVAAEFLVPAHILREFWKDLADIQKLATRLKVSTIFIARRALDLELISKTQFYTFYNKYIEQFRVKKGGSGGNFYSTSKRRVSPTFASFVDSAVQSGELTYKDAFKLTGLYGNVYTQFIQKHVTTVK